MAQLWSEVFMQSSCDNVVRPPCPLVTEDPFLITEKTLIGTPGMFCVKPECDLGSSWFI